MNRLFILSSIVIFFTAKSISAIESTPLKANINYVSIPESWHSEPDYTITIQKNSRSYYKLLCMYTLNKTVDFWNKILLDKLGFQDRNDYQITKVTSGKQEIYLMHFLKKSLVLSFYVLP